MKKAVCAFFTRLSKARSIRNATKPGWRLHFNRVEKSYRPRPSVIFTMPATARNPSAYLVTAALFALIAVIRIVAGYSQTAQGFDEPCHVGAAIELLDRGTYTLDPVHPPL